MRWTVRGERVTPAARADGHRMKEDLGEARPTVAPQPPRRSPVTLAIYKKTGPVFNEHWPRSIRTTLKYRSIAT